MNLFSISQLGRFSGLKPHTIRAWEARYNALKPARSDGNTRYYDGVQMKRLLNLVSLVKAGYNPSEVGGLPDDKLHQLLESVFTTRHHTTEDYFISQLIAAGLTYDEARFEKTFAHCITRYRLKNTYQYVLLPMLERIGLMWRCDKTSPTQEHFVSNLIRRKLFAAADSLPPPDAGSDRWLLFLPEGEFHELGLLVAYNLIRLSGHHAIYLGANVPFAALGQAINETRPDRVLLFTLQPELSRSMLGFLEEMEKSFKGKKLYVAGNPAKATAGAFGRVQWLRTVEDLTTVLTA
jgi:DNA-binding transcriptional MerR regulator